MQRFRAEINRPRRRREGVLHRHHDWPQDAPSLANASGVIAQIRAMFGGPDQPCLPRTIATRESSNDGALGHMTKTSTSSVTDGTEDSTGMLTAMRNEIYRRSLAATTPFARTLTTLLGPDALLWLLAQSREGVGKIQPHEFSRAGWPQLWEMDTQLAIEQELMRIDRARTPCRGSGRTRLDDAALALHDARPVLAEEHRI